jgi:uncharacterized protein (DUF433 family)
LLSSWFIIRLLGVFLLYRGRVYEALGKGLDAIEREPYKVSGAWVFRKTRVPVSALFENLRDGATVEEFLEWFPPVQRSQVEAVLNYELDMLAEVA